MRYVSISEILVRGFQQFCKVVVIIPKALCFVGAARGVTSYLSGSRGMPLQENFKIIEDSEMLFPVFLEPKNQFPRQGWSSLKLSLKSTCK